jgi:hypothetical protein
MVRSLIPDPLQLLREAVNRLEAGANALASRRIAQSQQLAKAINRLAIAALGVERVLDKVRSGVLARLDLPSRSDVAALTLAVQRIEDKLDQLLPASARSSTAPHPARTRRPPAVPRAAPSAAAAGVASSASRTAPRRARKAAGP